MDTDRFFLAANTFLAVLFAILAMRTHEPLALFALYTLLAALSSVQVVLGIVVKAER